MCITNIQTNDVTNSRGIGDITDLNRLIYNTTDKYYLFNMVLSAASTGVTDEVKGGKDIPKEEQNSSVTEEVGYNSPLSDGKYIICTL